MMGMYRSDRTLKALPCRIYNLPNPYIMIHHCISHAQGCVCGTREGCLDADTLLCSIG
jgi:hypothetical protein